jgi:hypothetical protein
MAYSAFKQSPIKRWESTPGACMSGSQITYLSPVADTTRIADTMELHYENGMCPNVGDIVRYSRITGALTLADAEYELEPGVDPEESSEVVGVVERVEPNCDQGSGDKATGTVVMFGRIDFDGHMPNGKTLTPGKVYYLTDSSEDSTYGDPHAMHMYRNGSSQEPVGVSKPVYIATTPTSAIVTNFRGLMGGSKDYVSDEVLITSECNDNGFVVTVSNTGTRPWATPMTNLIINHDPMTGDPDAVGTPSNASWIVPGTYNPETGQGQFDDSFIADSHAGVLQPSEQKQMVIGTADFPLIGKLSATLMSDDVPRASTHVVCLPTLSLSADCATGDEKAKFTIAIDPSSRGMVDELYFNILEKDSNGDYQTLKVSDDASQMSLEGSVKLPREDESGVSYVYEVDIEDEYGSSKRGDYKIQFPGVQDESHWAWESVGSGLTLSCTVSECVCEGGGDTHCLIFPHDPELRKTYGPSEAGSYELDGTTRRGSTTDFPNGHPLVASYDVNIVDGTYITRNVWMGNTSRINDDGTEGRMCGTLVGTPEELHMALTFKIADDAAICFPKHTADMLAPGGVSWEINIWQNRAIKTAYGDPIVHFGVGDAPQDPNVLITILLGYDDVSGEFSDCFSVPMKAGDYYIDEELNG